MSNEGWEWLDLHIDSWQGSREWGEQVTDAMREAVAEQVKASKKIAGKIKTSKQQHHAYADFLTFLLTQIQSEELITTLWKLFFTSKDLYHDIVYTKKSTNYPVMIGIFVPFFREKIVEFKMKSLYDSIITPLPLTPTSYLHYLKSLISTMNDNIMLDKELFTKCINLIFNEFQLVDFSNLHENQLTELQELIQQELFTHA